MSLSLAEEREMIRPSVEIRRWTYGTAALLLGVLVLCSIVIVRGIHTGEFSYNVDETQHAVTGLFAADLIRDHPLAHPVQYTYLYYAQYPALGGVVHWPPLFYLFEGLGFLVLGPTVVVARLTILFFALLGISFWFLLVREVQDDWTAAFAAVVFALLPPVLLFEKTVMLEIPSFALCVAAIFFWTRYLRHGRPRPDLYCFVAFASMALLTKQNSVFLVVFCLLTGLYFGGVRFLLRRPVLAVAAACLALTAPFYVLVYSMHWKSVAMDLGDNGVSGIQSLLFYWKTLPAQLGWTLFLLSVIGMITSRAWSRPRIPLLMLSWIAACYLTFTAIGTKAPRHVLYWLPPFVYFATGMLLNFFRKPWLRKTAAVAAVCTLGTSLVTAWSFRRPYVAGYAPAAKRITELSRSGIILFDGDLPGNFIFFLRVDDPGRHFVVLRKALYAARISSRHGSVELVHSRDELEDLIRKYGVRFVVVSEGVPLHYDSQRLLREEVRTARFKEVGRFHIEGSNPPGPGDSLVIYQNENYAPPSEKLLRIRMLTLNDDIVVPMDSFVLEDSLRSSPSSGDPSAMGK